MRLFTAIELPDQARDALVTCQEVLRRAIRPRVSWTRPENLHVTLKFIGEVGDTLYAPIVTALNSLAARGAFEISIGALLLMPPRGPTRVVAAALNDPNASIEAVYLQIESALEPLGIERDTRRYRPHITLGRVRERARIDPSNIELPSVNSILVPVNESVLIQSAQSPAGSRYDVLERFALTERSAG